MWTQAQAEDSPRVILLHPLQHGTLQMDIITDMEPSQMDIIADSSASYGLMVFKMLFRYLISTSFTRTSGIPPVVLDEDGRGRG